MTLSLYDLTGIQRYVLGSNVLADNLGASYLVHEALNAWLRNCSQGDGHVLWTGGGNAMVESPELAAARRIATRLSRTLHERAPGLDIACAHTDESDYGRAVETLQAQIRRAKLGRVPPASFDGGGVTFSCRETGEPAVDGDGSRRRGPSIRARATHATKAKERLEGLLPPLGGGAVSPSLVWTSEIDHLGRSEGEQSFVGVMHFDGNGMGKRFEAAATLGREAVSSLSWAINDAGTNTIKDAIRWVEQRITRSPMSCWLGHPICGGFELHQEGNGRAFPVRPIVYGGDDITLVCEGRIALDLAAELLHAWNRHTTDLDGGPAHACIGIALMKSHFPFYRAYRHAEGLCRRAKQIVQGWETQRPGHRFSALHWRVLSGTGLEEIDMPVAADSSALEARPYAVVGTPPAAWRTWDWLRNTLIEDLHSRGDDEHTWLKTIASQLHQGEAETEHFLKRSYDRGHERLPAPAEQPGFADHGFIGRETPLLDAIELLDFTLPSAAFGGTP